MGGGDIRGKFIVIASSYNKYKEIADVLTEMGLRERTNYIWAENLNKKEVVLYGNCHMKALENYLSNNLYFTSQYRLSVIIAYEPWRDECDEILRHCNVLICQDIRDHNDAGVCSAKEIEAKTTNCICIKIPNVYNFRSFFPQSADLDTRIRHMHHLSRDAVYINPDDMGNPTQTEPIRLLKSHIVFMAQRDNHIDRLYTEGRGIKEISDSILFEDVYKHVSEAFDYDIEKIRKREKLCDIKISDFILKNYKTKLLFYDQYHPTNFIIREMGIQILSLLKIPVFEEIPMTYVLNPYEVFIYGCVKRELGMQFEQKYIRCGRRDFTLWNAPMDLDTYVKQYITWNFGNETKERTNVSVNK